MVTSSEVGLEIPVAVDVLVEVVMVSVLLGDL
jgi:hypothetical protein